MSDGADTIEVGVRLGGPADDEVRALFDRYAAHTAEETRLCDPDDGMDLPAPETWLRAYVPSGDLETRLSLELGLWRLDREHGVTSTTRRLSEANWAEAWKAHYRPVRAGRHVVVCPSWLEPEAGPSDVVVRLDPGMAFGTGQHPTTRLCLAAIERHVVPGDHVLDVGTGSGVLAIAAALLGAGRVAAIDTAPHAVDIARANASANGVAIDARVGEIGAVDGVYHLVAANLLAPTLIEIAVDLVGRIRPGGTLVASGVLVEQAGEVAAALEAAGLPAPAVDVEGDWVALVSTLPGGSRA